MKIGIGTALAIGIASLSLVSEVFADAPETYHAISLRGGVYNEDQTYQGWEAKYSAPFLGVQLDGRAPLGTVISIDGLGSFDLADGNYSETEDIADFNQTLARLKLQAALALNLPIDQLVISPFAGIGLRYWYRGEGDGITPYIETWEAVYGVIGIRGEIKTGQNALFGQIDAQLPLNEKITTDSTLGLDYEFGSGDKTSMITAEAGVKNSKCSVSLFVEAFKYSNDYSQPLGLGLGDEITSTTIGGRLGFIF